MSAYPLIISFGFRGKNGDPMQTRRWCDSNRFGNIRAYPFEMLGAYPRPRIDSKFEKKKKMRNNRFDVIDNNRALESVNKFKKLNPPF